MSHNHLHPKEVGLIRMLQVLVWSEDKDLERKAKKFLNNEFGEYLFLIDVETLSVFESVHPSKHGELVDKYDFHLIKLEDQKASLTFVNSTKIEDRFELDNFEELLEKYARQLIYYYHENFKLD